MLRPPLFQVPPTLILPGLRIALAALATLMTAIGLRRGGNSFLSTLVHDIATAPIKIAGTWRRIVHRSQNAAGEDALHTEVASASFFNRFASMIGYSGFTLYYLADAIFTSFYLLIHVRIPRMIRHHVTHVSEVARAAERQAALGLSRVASTAQALRHATTVALPAELGGIRTRERAFENYVKERLGKHLRWLAALTAAGVGAGLIARTLARETATRQCQNHKDWSKALCRMERGLLNSLIADALLIGGSISLVEFAKECQGFSGEVESGLRYFVRELRHLRG